MDLRATDPPPTLLARLLQDRPRDGAAPAAVVAAHQAVLDTGRGAVGPLVLDDTTLAAHARTTAGTAGLEVVVRVGGGAGGVAALAGRSVPGLRVVAVEATLRDLDDLAGNAARFAAAAAALTDVDVHLALPDAPGWVHAVEVVEAAGLLGLVCTDVTVGHPLAAVTALAARLSVLVEADLPFAVALDDPTLARPGLAVAGLAMLVEALVDGAEPEEAALLLHGAEPDRVRAGLARWDDATATRVRRRLRAVDLAAGPALDDLADLGLLTSGR